MNEDGFITMIMGKPGNTMNYIREEMEFLGIDFTFIENDSIICSIPEKYVLPDRDIMERELDEIHARGSVNCDKAMELSHKVFPDICAMIFRTYDTISNFKPQGHSIFETYLDLKLNMLKMLSDNGHTPIDNNIQSDTLLKLLNMFGSPEDVPKIFVPINPNIRKGVVWTPIKGLERLINYMDNRDMVSLFAYMSDSKE